MNYLLISRHHHHAPSGIQTYLDAVLKHLSKNRVRIVTLRSHREPKQVYSNHTAMLCDTSSQNKGLLYSCIFKLFIKGDFAFIVLLILNRAIRKQINSRFNAAFALCKAEQFDFIISMNLYEEGVIALLLQKLYGIPATVLLHGSEVHSFHGRLQLKFLIRYILNNVNLVIANSNFMAKETVRVFNTKTNNIVVNHLGFDSSLFPKTSISDETINRSEKTCVILTVSNLVPGKGVDILLDALGIVKQTHCSFHYNMVGDVKDEAYFNILNKKIQDNELHDYVTQHPAKKHNELRALYQQCDFLVLPSRQEAFGLVVLEANACAIPVVGAAVGGIPEIIDDKKTGLLFKPNNPEDLAEKITVLLTDKKLCKELGQKAYEKVHENLTWQASMSRLISKITGLKHE